jgi:glycosyltransferase involved in cell wall biosynthesis
VSALLPIDVVIPTRHRPDELRRFLESVARLKHQPASIIIGDASTDARTKTLCDTPIKGLDSRVHHVALSRPGVAEQRLAVMHHAAREYVMFCDDDIQFIDETFEKLLQTLAADRRLGGVSAMIEGAQFHPPSAVGRLFYRVVFGRKASSLPGACFGPTIVMWVRADAEGRLHRAEWLPTGCVLYRAAALPRPVFPRWMRGLVTYEDVALSLEVARRWRLAVHTGTMVLHRSATGDHKRSAFASARRGLRDRYRVATRVMRRRRLRVAIELLLVEAYHVLAAHRRAGGLRALPVRVAGRLAAVPFIVADLFSRTTRIAPRGVHARGDFIRPRKD